MEWMLSGVKESQAQKERKEQEEKGMNTLNEGEEEGEKMKLLIREENKRQAAGELEDENRRK